jgi:transcriptional regulator of acetoin/glycerol metabolism
MALSKKGSDAELRNARHFLMERGQLPAGLIQDVVARSWQRSLGAGIVPTGRLVEVPLLNQFELAHVIDRQQELIANARPVMEYLHSQTRDSDSLVILSDEHGVLLQALGDAHFLTRAERVALMPGATWNESYRGTNAIGTALAERSPVVVHGAEHYLECNSFLTCAATPICAPDGRLLGVINISSEKKIRHPHTFSLVRAAGQMIENRLFEVRHGDSMRLRFHPLAEGIGTIAEGMVSISEEGIIVGANQAALVLLHLAASKLGAISLSQLFDLRFKDLLDWGIRRTNKALLIKLAQGGHFFARVESGSGTIQLPKGAITLVLKAHDTLSRLDTGDSSMRTAIERARKVMAKPIPLLLQGESGVGKELFAKAVHQSGPRCEKNFVAVNCAALPENLIEAELFGYAPGAFTGARREGSAGRIREAHGGTLFLDEIGDMPQSAQCRLLRVLQERQVTPLGGGRSIAVDFKLICATHRNLKIEMEAGRFRTDLYYRINGLTLMLPSLHERSDFNTLTIAIIEAAAPKRGIALDEKLARHFADYTWPGNIRQLSNALHTACALLDDDEAIISWHHMPDDLAGELMSLEFTQVSQPQAVTDNLKSLSDTTIQRAIVAVKGNMSEAARRLGISRNTLYRKLKKHA